MKNIGQNNLPVKCRDPFGKHVPCPGFRPGNLMPDAPCMFICGAFCGADTEDFKGFTLDSKGEFNAHQTTVIALRSQISRRL